MADQATAGQQQPPAYMLVAADELGVLKGAFKILRCQQQGDGCWVYTRRG